MKRVEILQQVSGTRNGVDWPPKGAEWELPDAEADDYEAAGFVKILPEQEGRPKTPASYAPEKDVERAAGPDPKVEVRAEPPKGPVTRATGPVPK